jgi:hypothetical protein
MFLRDVGIMYQTTGCHILGGQNLHIQHSANFYNVMRKIGARRSEVNVSFKHTEERTTRSQRSGHFVTTGLRAALDRVTPTSSSATVARHHCRLGDNNCRYVCNENQDIIVTYRISLTTRQLERQR